MPESVAGGGKGSRIRPLSGMHALEALSTAVACLLGASSASSLPQAGAGSGARQELAAKHEPTEPRDRTQACDGASRLLTPRR
jgi:hypothetical protein